MHIAYKITLFCEKCNHRKKIFSLCGFVSEYKVVGENCLLWCSHCIDKCEL